MLRIDERLAKKGKKEPREGLMQQGIVHLALAKRFPAELAENGWTSDDTVTFEGRVAALGSTVSAQADARLLASAALDTEASSMADAKKFIRKLRNGLPRALREAQEPGLTMAAFAPGETLGYSTPKVSAYLTRILPAVAKLDNYLTKCFGGKKASEVLADRKSALDGAGVTQEIAWKSLPRETLLVCEIKGRVLEGIEDLNRAGKSAFEEQPETVALFSKEVLARARHERKKKPKPNANAPMAATAPASAQEASCAEAKAKAVAPAEARAPMVAGAAPTSGSRKSNPLPVFLFNTLDLRARPEASSLPSRIKHGLQSVPVTYPPCDL